MQPNLVRYSKFISLVLRHKPQTIGLQLDEAGWASIDALLAGMKARGMRIDRSLLDQIVAENDKQRFAFSADGTKIRASQGHSLPVELGLQPTPPPDQLYHGTARKNLNAILAQGLLRGNRQAVHLSRDLQTAIQVGRRHGEPVVLQVDCARMAADGFTFTCSANGVWLVEHVPPHYLRVVDGTEEA